MTNPITTFFAERKAKKEAEARAKLEAEAKENAHKEAKEKENAPQNYIDAAIAFIRDLGNRFYPPREKQRFYCTTDYSWQRLLSWAQAEKKYAELGYRTISLDVLQKTGGSPQSMAEHLCIKRDPGEEPIFHAELFKRFYIDSIESAIELRELQKRSGANGNKKLYPSTEALVNLEKQAKEREAQ